MTREGVIFSCAIGSHRWHTARLQQWRTLLPTTPPWIIALDGIRVAIGAIVCDHTANHIQVVFMLQRCSSCASSNQLRCSSQTIGFGVPTTKKEGSSEI